MLVSRLEIVLVFVRAGLLQDAGFDRVLGRDVGALIKGREVVFQERGQVLILKIKY